MMLSRKEGGNRKSLFRKLPKKMLYTQKDVLQEFLLIRIKEKEGYLT